LAEVAVAAVKLAAADVDVVVINNLLIAQPTSPKKSRTSLEGGFFVGV
jgi:hypothetical protein